MKVLLINPSGGYPRHEYPPLGLLYIASVAENAGHSVVIYDEGAINKRRQTLFDAIESYQPDICGISLFTTNIDATFNTIASIKRMLQIVRWLLAVLMLQHYPCEPWKNVFTLIFWSMAKVSILFGNCSKI